MDKQTLKFKKNETFHIREGWLQKAIIAIGKGESIFSKNNGNVILGIGTNMVKALRYWLQACDITKRDSLKTELTDFGNLLLEYDRYIENNFSLFLIHYNLVTNIFYNPIGYTIFNMNINSFTKQDISEAIVMYLNEKDYKVKKDYVDDDLTVFLSSYFNDDKYKNPEDNYFCPLSNLKLLRKQGNKYVKNCPHYGDLSYLVVYYSLCCMYEREKSFNISDSMNEPKSPTRIFNLDKSIYLQYLDEMKNNKLITINKTAGLNSVYFEKKLSLKDIFKIYFRGHKNV